MSKKNGDSKFTLRDLKSRGSQLLADFEDYL
jgi:hypothetical protein